MEGNFINKFFNNIKTKFQNNKKNYSQEFEYVFSDEELNNLDKQNKEKIKELKNNNIKKKEVKEDITVTDTLENIFTDTITPSQEDIELPKESKQEESKQEESKENNQDEDKITYDDIVNNILKEPIEKESLSTQTISYINPNPEMKKTITEKLNIVDIKILERYIAKGKDILSHNYSITYGEDAIKYINDIKQEYPDLINYFIGFNNEKKEIYNKTTFSDSQETEWHYLKHYLKILEQIKSLKK